MLSLTSSCSGRGRAESFPAAFPARGAIVAEAGPAAAGAGEAGAGGAGGVSAAEALTSGPD